MRRLNQGTRLRPGRRSSTTQFPSPRTDPAAAEGVTSPADSLNVEASPSLGALVSRAEGERFRPDREANGRPAPGAVEDERPSPEPQEVLFHETVPAHPRPAAVPALPGRPGGPPGAHLAAGGLSGKPRRGRPRQPHCDG